MEECDGGGVTDSREVRDTGTARVIACRRGEEYGLINEECGKSVEKHWWVQPKEEPVPGGAQCFYRRGRGAGNWRGRVFPPLLFVA